MRRPFFIPGLLIATVLFEYVVAEFYKLGIHPVNNPVCRASNGTHDLVDQLWMRINDGLERGPRQRQYVRLTKRPQAHRVRRAIDKTQLARQLAVAENSKAGKIVSTGALYDLNLSNQDDVQGIVAGSVFDEKVAIDQLALGHEAAQDLDFRICQLGAQGRVDNQSRNIVHGTYYPLRKIQGQLGLATLLNYRDYQDNTAMIKLTKSYMTGEGSGQLLYETIGNCFDRIVEENPDSPALIVPFQDVRWTYREFQAQVDRLAAGLISLGIETGDRVGIWGPNSYEWVLTQFATARIGAIMVCINPAYRLFELEYVMNKVECKAIISAERFKSSEYLQMLNALAPEIATCEPGYLRAATLPHLTTVIRMGDGRSPGMFNFEEVCELGGKHAKRRLAEFSTELGPDDAINIQFTSGTTGSPKGATLTHCNILNNGYNAGLGMRFTPGDKLCMPVPLYHCFGMVLGVLACVTTGAAIVLPSPVYDPVSTLRAVEEEQCTALHGVPTMFVTELDHPDFESFDVSSLRTGIIAGAPCPEELMKRIIADMHMDNVLIAYGQTELSPVNHMTLPEDSLENRTQTVGRPIPYIEVKIVDANDRVVPIGEQGEICTRGYSVMKGYWNDEEKTAETIIDGWLHSGDLGTMNEHGYVRITGRIKDMIIRGGENIYPREIEEFLSTHPDIREVQVFGVEDMRMGEEVCAWIRLRKDSSVTQDDIQEFCKGQISHFKIPRYVRFVEEFPMTVTGKVRKVEMRAMMAEELRGAA